MKVTMSMVGLIALCSAGLAARSTHMKDSDVGKRAKDAALTVTGCVALGDRVGHYLLIDAAAAGAAMPDDDMHMGDMAPRTYSLLGGKLEPHVGHRVEVIGRKDMVRADATKHQDGMVSHSMSHEPGMAMPAATLRITSIRAVGGSCS